MSTTVKIEEGIARVLRLILDSGELTWRNPPIDEAAEDRRIRELATLAISVGQLPETAPAWRPAVRRTFRDLRRDPDRWHNATDLMAPNATVGRIPVAIPTPPATTESERESPLSPWILAAIGLIVAGTFLAIPMIESRLPILGQLLSANLV